MTETTASLKQNKQCRCLLRRCLVEATPEELVRQSVVFRLIHVLGYPPSLMVIEKKLSELPLNRATKLPNRRVDLLVYSSNMEPLLLIECKASNVTASSLRQVLGYNRFVHALSVAVIGREQEFCLLGKGIVRELPSWEELNRHLSSRKKDA